MRSGLVLALTAALTLSACGAEATGDPELTIYLSAPLSGPRAADGRDVADGARLALAEAGTESAGTTVLLEVLDDGNEGGWDAATAAANARRATEDSSAIAFLGDLDSGATRSSLPITNEAGILQVSPGSGAEDLTRDVPGSSQVPDLVQPTGNRTFGRVVPSDRAQAEAAAGWMSALGIRSVEILMDESNFAESLRAGIEAGDGPAIDAGGADATYVATADLEGSASSSAPRGRGSVFGSDALLDPADLKALGTLGDRAMLTAAALAPSQLPAGADEFLRAFRAEYGRDPGPYAAYGYEAMAVTLDAIGRAEDPLDRAAVIDAFFATADRESVLGTYSIDEVGDTTLGRLGAYEVAGGRTEPLPESLERG